MYFECLLDLATGRNLDRFIAILVQMDSPKTVLLRTLLAPE